LDRAIQVISEIQHGYDSTCKNYAAQSEIRKSNFNLSNKSLEHFRDVIIKAFSMELRGDR